MYILQHAHSQPFELNSECLDLFLQHSTITKRRKDGFHHRTYLLPLILVHAIDTRRGKHCTSLDGNTAVVKRRPASQNK